MATCRKARLIFSDQRYSVSTKSWMMPLTHMASSWSSLPTSTCSLVSRFTYFSVAFRCPVLRGEYLNSVAMLLSLRTGERSLGLEGGEKNVRNRLAIESFCFSSGY